MKPLVALLPTLILILTSGCQTLYVSPADTLTPTPPPATTSTPDLPPTTTPLPVTPTQTPVPSLEPVPSPMDVRSQYTLTARLDYGWRTLSVEQDILIPNPSSDTISELVLVVQPNWRPGAFTLTALTWGDDTPINTYSLEGIRLQIILSDPFEPGETIHISLSYEINIPPILTSEAFGPNPFGYTARQINLTDWYPFVPPYISGSGWLVHNPWYYGEYLVYPAADFDISLQLDNAPPGTVIAASARDTGEGSLHRYHLEQGRNFVLSLSPEYKVLQEQVGETTVLGYAFPYESAPAEAAFKTTYEALELYSRLFGPYPFDTLTLVQADFDHGMEYTGLYFLSKAFYSIYDGTPSTYLVAIAAHETAHQWWYGLVGNDQALEPWLDEALCTYSEKLFYENLYPKSLAWWQYARLDYYESTGWVDSSIYDTPGYRPYRDAVYLNGAVFLDELRALIGDQAFFAFLPDYISRYTALLASADDFFGILSEHTSADWGHLLAEYFQSR
ncbi:MAG: M1 family metallopeptidase [Anaerolineales bacterium]|nr:M1 family metallopeptidase [Anaerolineales bacterium]